MTIELFVHPLFKYFWGFNYFHIYPLEAFWGTLAEAAVKDPGSRYFMSSPLSAWLNYSFYAVFNRLFKLTGQQSLGIMQAFAGIIYAYIIIRIGRILYPKRAKQVMFLILMFSAGYMKSFVYNSHIMCWPLVMAAAYIWASITYLQKKTSIVLPALSYAVGFWTHISFGFFGPSLIYLALNGDQKANLVRITAVLLIASFAIISLIEFDSYSSFHKHVWELGRGDLPKTPTSGFIPLYGEYYINEDRYTIFSPMHIIEMFNEQVYIAFGGFFLIPIAFYLYRPQLDSISYFLLIMVGAYCVYQLIWRPDHGMPDDWNLFTTGAVPTLIWISYAGPLKAKFQE